jgi:hypothetical protein
MMGAAGHQWHVEDFTEARYADLLMLAMRTWRPIGYAEALAAHGRTCLWRHDVDFSPHRARRLAEIEHEAGVRATYFILLHSNFYNALETEVLAHFRTIAGLGHDLGLHFDPQAFGERLTEPGALDAALRREAAIISSYLEVPVHAFSYHNPDTIPGGIREDDEVGGMVNAYGRSIRARYGYVSDSNGYWRFRRLQEVLESGAEDSIHVLTHPEWWTPEPMLPRDRVTRCIEGRARAQHDAYDGLLATMGRTNVR